MARLLFVMKYPLHRHDNLKTKFDGQMAAAQALGHEVRYLGWDKRGVWLCGQRDKALLVKSAFTNLPGYSHTLLFVELMTALKRAAAQAPYDLVYMRYMPTFANAVSALKTAKDGGARLIVEHPTYPFENGKKTNLLRRPVFWYADRVFKHIVPMIDLYTLIGDPNDGWLDGRPAMNILNGVDADSVPLHQPRPQDTSVHLLALASMSHWQGYDRLLRAMAHYGGDTVLHLAGTEGDGSLKEWLHLAETLGLGERVVYEGEAYGDKLNALAARCDVGIGGLGLYRKGQLCSMTLKLREYMARGLPFVYAVDDPGVPDEPRFCLHIPNDDSLPDMEAIEGFARKAKQDFTAPAQMRDYAKAHMSWTGVLRPVLERVGIACQEP